MKLFSKLHLDPIFGTLLKSHLSSKTHPGVLKDMDAHDGAGDGARIHIKSLGTSSRLLLSSKSPSGVLEDMDVLDGA